MNQFFGYFFSLLHFHATILYLKLKCRFFFFKNYLLVFFEKPRFMTKALERLE